MVEVIRPYYGKVIRSFGFNGLKLTEAVYAPNVQLPSHSHPKASYCFILKGGYTERYGRLHLDCLPFHVKFQPAGESHTDSYGTAQGCSLIVELDDSWLQRMNDCSLPVSAPALSGDIHVFSIVSRIRHELYHSDDASPIFLEGFMLEVLAGLARNRIHSPRPESDRRKTIMEYLHAHFTEQLTLDQISGVAHIHPVYLANLFRRWNGCSIGEYLRKLRIEFAVELLSKTDQPLIEIAHSAGFSNQSHFTRIFRQHTGQTPARFRAAIRS